MQDEFAKYFRCVADDQGWAFEVAMIGWEGVYTPVVTWRVFRRWKRKPTDVSIARARAAALKNRTLFRLCELCDEVHAAGDDLRSVLVGVAQLLYDGVFEGSGGSGALRA